MSRQFRRKIGGRKSWATRSKVFRWSVIGGQKFYAYRGEDVETKERRESRRRRRARTQLARRKTKRQAWRAEYGNSQLVRGRLAALKVPTVLSTVLSKYRISIARRVYAPYPFFYSFADQRIQRIQKVGKTRFKQSSTTILAFLEKFFLRNKVKIGCSD